MIEAIIKRRSLRVFLEKEVEEEKLREVMKAAMYAPTSKSTRAWEFVVVRSPEMKEALSKATPHSKFVKGASVVVVVCYDNERGYRFREDSSISAEHIHLEAVNQGLASCFVQVCDAGEPRGSAEPYVKRVLNIPDRYRVQCMMPLGYPGRETRDHDESEFDASKIHIERFGGGGGGKGPGRG